MYDSPARYDSATTDSHKKKGRPCKAVAMTAREYSGASSIHGFAYIIEPSHGPFLRVLWLAVVLGMAAVGVYLSIQVRHFKYYLPGSTSSYLLSTKVYEDWLEDPVLTTIKTTTKPISEIDFPSITICGQGTIDEVGSCHENKSA